jgi:hypothetical protein
VIAPTALLERYCVTSYHLALAHLVLEDDAYRYFYATRRRQGDFIIMDNSVIELEDPLPASDLMKAVLMTGAQEVVLPDHPWDSKATLEDARTYSTWVFERFPVVNQMAVPQGRDVQDWMDCLVNMVEVPYIDTIGIPKSLGQNRLVVMKEIDQLRRELPAWNYHLLGTWGNPNEIQFAANHYEWIRGVDSKIPIRAGLAGIQFHPTKGLMTERHQLPTLQFDVTEDPFPAVTQYNVNMYIQWAEGISNIEGVIPFDPSHRRHRGTRIEQAE